jgi:hypothetical protein
LGFIALVGLGVELIPALCGAAEPLGTEPQTAKDGENTMTETKTSPRTNRLINATSPYLLQHAQNPVDWYEWGPEAFEKAQREDKPIFLSIGYAACHWCHVMEHESFESQEIAAILNAGFVSVKVDREERPDLDEIYMAYTQARTGHGGWPMSVWLTSEGVPFLAGTYFPRGQFRNVLEQIGDAWVHRREQIVSGAEGALDFYTSWSAPSSSTGIPDLAHVDESARSVARAFDRRLGGMSGGGRNKFPPCMAMELMLRVHRRTGDKDLLEAVEVTLDQMARGGIYDHVGGGICRYSTDPEWLVPHFEKMLYDQALVSSIYLDAYQLTRKTEYAEVARDILEYVLADLQSPEGGFYSSRDADSEGLEGAFYIWTVDEVQAVLGEQEARTFCAYFDVTETGNWFESLGHAPPGPKNILHVPKPPEVFAKLRGITVEELKRSVADWRPKMRAARNRRTPPALDDKVLTAWNGLMIGALGKGAVVLDEPRYADAAAKASGFILDRMRRDGRLLRTYRKGQARLTAYLEDYAFFIEGLLHLYEATFERRWLEAAAGLNELALRFHYDETGGAFYFTASDAEKLVARTKNPHDSAIPSGNSVQALNLLRLATLLDRKDYREKAEATFRALAAEVRRMPYAYERHLCALDFFHDRTKEIALVGDPGTAEFRALLRVIHDRYLPNKILAQAQERSDDPRIPLLKGKGRINGQAAAYVCENFTCQRPVTTPNDLAGQLEPKR